MKETSGNQTERPGHVRIPTVTIDEIVEKQHVRFMKVDVQGGESGVLRGASRTLADGRMDLMYLEFSEDETLLDCLSRFPLSIFDSEYLLIPENHEVDFRDWQISTQVILSTGRKAYRGYPKYRPADSEGYVRFMNDQNRKIGIVETNLIVASNQILPALITAVTRLR